MAKKSVRKRFVRKKRRRNSSNRTISTSESSSLKHEVSRCQASIAQNSVSESSNPQDFTEFELAHDCHQNHLKQCRVHEELQPSAIVLDHDYAEKIPPKASSDVSDDSSVEDDFSFKLNCQPSQRESPPSPEVSTKVLLQIKNKLDCFLPHRWLSFVKQDAITVIYMSIGKNAAIQRSLVFSCNGDVELFVHCEKLDVDPYMKGIGPFIPFNNDNVNDFVDRAATVINNVRLMQICSGCDEEKFRNVWSNCHLGIVDTNPYKEDRYVETFRSVSCSRLVTSRKWRCSECAKLYKPLKRRSVSATVERPKLHTANKYLTESQMLNKLEDQAKQIDNANRKISRLKARMQHLIQINGVQVDENMSDDLFEILQNRSDLTPAQSIFIHQQVKASQKKKMVGMRWHPTFIRMALAIHLTSPAAYELLRNTGMVKLPCSRTLFDYSHTKPIEEGIDRVVLDSLGKRVAEFKKRYMKYHVLMSDEMHISQNLVFQKNNGKMIGYTSLDSLDSEVKLFEQYLDNPDREVEARVATKVLVFMVKGTANGVKEVVATFAVGNPSVTQMYDWTWKVIRALESSGVWIIALICDGFSTNRAFIRMHKPVTSNANGVIFDTINKAARHRSLYFIADVPHLLKTIRNCFLNSRWDGKKSRRKMRNNGKKISWDFIVKLYNSKKHKSLRKAFKLSPMNVFPDSYGRMKVKYAAEVLSLTVAKALEDEHWEDAAETIHFIRLVNNWFDCLNGAHTAVGRKKRNSNLDPYTKKQDERYKTLEDFLNYLHDWKKNCEKGNETINTTIGGNETMNRSAELDESAIDDGCDSDNPDFPASKCMLSRETLEGIEMTTRAFPLMVDFLIGEETPFINARIFTQDPLEQHFSKVRAGQGGSTNPNVGQVLKRNRAIHIIGQLGMKRKKGNCEEVGEVVEVTTEPLSKRKSVREPKFST